MLMYTVSIYLSIYLSIFEERIYYWYEHPANCNLKPICISVVDALLGYVGLSKLFHWRQGLARLRKAGEESVARGS